MHGGLFAAMLDVALAMSGSREPAPEDPLPSSTISFTFQYLSTLKLDYGFVVARAQRTGGGKSIFHSDCKVLAPSGRLIATATGIFKPGRKSLS